MDVRRRQLSIKSTKETFSAEVGDIVCANSNGTKKIVNNISQIPSGFMPIAVVVIPSSHNVYGTGECCAMSLNNMSCETPDIGTSSYEKIYWGGSNINTPELMDFTLVNYIGSSGKLYDTVQGVSDVAYLPSEIFTNILSKDGISRYYYNNSGKYAPSPFNSDGTRNQSYYITSASTLNALSDFNGKINTEIIISKADETLWKSGKIINGSGANSRPAACSCWRYSTIGTLQGDWYLPATGELGYICTRQSTINNTLQSIINAYPAVSCAILSQSAYIHWSSTEYGGNLARIILFDDGTVYYISKGNSYYTRSCIRV